MRHILTAKIQAFTVKFNLGTETTHYCMYTAHRLLFLGGPCVSPWPRAVGSASADGLKFIIICTTCKVQTYSGGASWGPKGAIAPSTLEKFLSVCLIIRLEYKRILRVHA